MQNLIKQEQFEIEVLERLNSKKLLKNFVFCGGSMLRLCYGLDRYSNDLDFWLLRNINVKKSFNDLKECLGRYYKLSDAAKKFYILLFEIRSKDYPRSLKIEIRKEPKKVNIERAIAFSKHSNTQVMLNVVSLKNMMAAKIDSFIQRREIRDVFDIEFLFKKGIVLPDQKKTIEQLSAAINLLTRRDYTVKLGSLLEGKFRKYYVSENFKILKMAIGSKIEKQSVDSRW